MAQTAPLISVIIPVYNCESYLAEAIESVLHQSLSPHEIIVIDDGSEDGSAKVAQSFGSAVRYSFQANQGTGSARNYGVQLAQGKFIAFLDADDVWMKHKSARQMTAFEDEPSLHIVSGHLQHFHSPELSPDIKSRTYCPRALMAAALAGALIRREFFEKVGPFEVNWNVGEGISWYLRAAEIGLRVLTLPDVVIRRRLHESNQTIRNRAHIAEYTRIIKGSLDRRRGRS